MAEDQRSVMKKKPRIREIEWSKRAALMKIIIIIIIGMAAQRQLLKTGLVLMASVTEKNKVELSA